MELSLIKNKILKDIELIDNDFAILYELIYCIEWRKILIVDNVTINKPFEYLINSYLGQDTERINYFHFFDNLGKYILLEKDLNEAEFKINYIISKLIEIKKGLEDNPPTKVMKLSRIIKKSDFDEHIKQNFIYLLQNEVQINFQDIDNFFVFNAIINKLNNLIENIENEYNNFKNNKSKKLNQNLVQHIKKQIDTINFTGATKRDLPYFFWQLQKLKLIEVDNLGLNLSKIFTYLNEPIDNTYFNAEFSKFEKGETPANATEIDKILLKPKKNIIKLK